MRKVIYPGTFDPPHLGHLDLIQRGRELFDEIIVAVGVNPRKEALFSREERVELLGLCTAEMDGVRVIELDGLVVDLLRREQARFILRGIRTFADFEAEYTMALTNRQLAGDHPAETLFVLPTLQYAHYSSKLVKEVAGLGGDVSEFLPPEVMSRILDRLRGGSPVA